MIASRDHPELDRVLAVVQPLGSRICEDSSGDINLQAGLFHRESGFVRDLAIATQGLIAAPAKRSLLKLDRVIERGGNRAPPDTHRPQEGRSESLLPLITLYLLSPHPRR